jgi:hypothetical protein
MDGPQTRRFPGVASCVITFELCSRATPLGCRPQSMTSAGSVLDGITPGQDATHPRGENGELPPKHAGSEDFATTWLGDYALGRSE